MKTAMSISNDLLQIVQVSNKKMIESLNEVYADTDTEQEKLLRRERKRHYASSLKAEPW